MSDERRRYFRIDEEVGVGYQVLSPNPDSAQDKLLENETKLTGILDQVEGPDARIEQLLVELEDSHPGVVELVTLFNQKLERVITHLLLDTHLIRRIARQVKVANLSACGIAFECAENVAVDTQLEMQLTLYPGEQKINTTGRVVNCEDLGDDSFYWRIDFFGMNKADQEALIQHIVRAQSSQLKSKRQS